MAARAKMKTAYTYKQPQLYIKHTCITSKLCHHGVKSSKIKVRRRDVVTAQFNQARQVSVSLPATLVPFQIRCKVYESTKATIMETIYLQH